MFSQVNTLMAGSLLAGCWGVHPMCESRVDFGHSSSCDTLWRCSGEGVLPGSCESRGGVSLSLRLAVFRAPNQGAGDPVVNAIPQIAGVTVGRCGTGIKTARHYRDAQMYCWRVWWCFLLVYSPRTFRWQALGLPGLARIV